MKVEELINKYYDSFTVNDQYICQCILNYKEDCIRLSIDDFAHKYHISSSALSRFAQKLKLPGYSELKVILRLDDTKYLYNYKNIDNMMYCYKKVIEGIEKKDCSVLFERMNQAQRIIIFGEGYTQGQVAKEMKRIFLPTGKKFYDTYGFDMIDSLLKFIKIDDIVFFISLNGDSKKLIDFAKEMKMKGVYTVSITKMLSNSLSQLCNESLYIQSTEIFIDNHIKYTVTTPYFILIELLYVKYKLYWSDMNILP